jgi:hydrogenase nickel incorporation protein HypB
MLPKERTMSAAPLSSRFELNSQMAAANRAAFALDGVTVVSLVGSSGSGKTSIIEAAVQHLEGRMRLATVVGNPAASRDAERLARLGVCAVPVQTDNLAANDVHNVLADLNLARMDMVFIETAGISPLELDLGQDLRVAVFGASGGDDKAAEYANLIAESDLVVLSKIDLLPHVTFDMNVFRADVAKANPAAELITLSARSGAGVEALLDSLARHWAPDKQFGAPRRAADQLEWFFG